LGGDWLYYYPYYSEVVYDVPDMYIGEEDTLAFIDIF
jgi:hypothetical protein